MHLLPLILTRWSAAAGCNDRMPMSIGSFSYTRSGLVSLARSQFRRSSDVTSPFPPSGNEGYIRNRDVLASNNWVKELSNSVVASNNWVKELSNSVVASNNWVKELSNSVLASNNWVKELSNSVLASNNWVKEVSNSVLASNNWVNELSIQLLLVTIE